MWMRAFTFMLVSISIGSMLPAVAGFDDGDENTRPEALFPQTTYSEFVAAHPFPYRADSGRIARIRRNFVDILEGLDMERVLVRIGDPDYIQHLYSKGPRPGFIGTSWIYVFEKQSPKQTNVFHDLTVEVFFDTTNRVARIFSNIDGLTPIHAVDPGHFHP